MRAAVRMYQNGALFAIQRVHNKLGADSDSMSSIFQRVAARMSNRTQHARQRMQDAKPDSIKGDLSAFLDDAAAELVARNMLVMSQTVSYTHLTLPTILLV